jgi:chromosome segregation ATPase
MNRMREIAAALVPLAVLVAAVAGLVVLGGKLFGGGDADEGGQAVAALGPPESSWVPGQPGLIEYERFFDIYAAAATGARQRVKERERRLKQIERRKREARERADAEAKRKYEEAKRRAKRLYELALKRAAEARRRQREKLAEARRKYREALRKREEQLKVPPGEECKFKNVRRHFDCRTGRLPDPAGDRARRRGGK